MNQWIQRSQENAALINGASEMTKEADHSWCKPVKEVAAHTKQTSEGEAAQESACS